MDLFLSAFFISNRKNKAMLRKIIFNAINLNRLFHPCEISKSVKPLTYKSLTDSIDHFEGVDNTHAQNIIDTSLYIVHTEQKCYYKSMGSLTNIIHFQWILIVILLIIILLFSVMSLLK